MLVDSKWMTKAKLGTKGGASFIQVILLRNPEPKI